MKIIMETITKEESDQKKGWYVEGRTIREENVIKTYYLDA